MRNNYKHCTKLWFFVLIMSCKVMDTKLFSTLTINYGILLLPRTLPPPLSQKSSVYRIAYTNCNVVYVGQTGRNLEQ